MTLNADELLALAEQATATPSLDAEAALEVLADVWLAAGWRSGLVTAEHHDPALARQKFLGHVFCRAWREMAGKWMPYSMPGRISGALNPSSCWVTLLSVPHEVWASVDHIVPPWVGSAQSPSEIMRVLRQNMIDGFSSGLEIDFGGDPFRIVPTWEQVGNDPLTGE